MVDGTTNPKLIAPAFIPSQIQQTAVLEAPS